LVKNTAKQTKEVAMSSSDLLHHKPNISDYELILHGYKLSTAIFYFRMPDFRHVLNFFTWQFYDLSPDYPRLFEFIEFWQTKLNGPLHSVEFTHCDHFLPNTWRRVVSVSDCPQQQKWGLT